jgi:hypothetical protein
LPFGGHVPKALGDEADNVDEVLDNVKTEMGISCNVKPENGKHQASVAPSPNLGFEQSATACLQKEAFGECEAPQL